MLDRELKDFINDHLNDDIVNIVLRTDSFPGIDIKKAVSIIESRKKLSSKFDYWAKHEDLIFTDPVAVEQSSSQVTAIHKQKFCDSGVVYDLTGGLGTDSYCFSLKNKCVVYFERNRRLFEEAEYNFKTLGIKNIRLINKEIAPDNISGIFDMLIREENLTPDIIYLDPARRKIGGRRVLFLKDYEPDITRIKDNLLRYSNRILVKISPMSDLKSAFNECGNVSNIDVLSIDNECKEILIVIDKGCNIQYGAVNISAVNYSSKKGVQIVNFSPQEEKNSSPVYIKSALGNYLYEPNSSILKAGAFKTTSVRYNLKKLSLNTHLYSGDNLVENFPGRVFEIKEVEDFCKSNIRNLSKKYPKVNISVRNFPIPATDLKKILKTEDGGDITLMGCTLDNSVKKMVICKQLF